MNERIFSVGYRRLDNSPRHRFAPWPIARTAMQLAWRRRATKVALLLCLSVLIGHGTWLVSQVLMSRFGGGASFGEEAMAATFGQAQEVLASFIRTQFFMGAFALAIIGAGLVADDRQAGAFDLYFARPLTRMDYALGKCIAAAAVPVLTLVAPALGLWFLAVGGTDSDRIPGLWALGLPTLATSVCAALWLTGALVGLSSMGEKSRTVGATFIAVIIGLAALGEALPAAGHTWGGYLSPERDFRTLTESLLQVGTASIGGQLLHHRGGQMNDSALGSFLALMAQAGAGFGALAFRLKREVVG